MDLDVLLKDRLHAVENLLQAACQRAGRDRGEVTLVAVTKTVNARVAERLHALGIRDLGENRPQELWRKADALPSTVFWHLIGHLQRNKIERTLPRVSLVHSVDSVRLLEAIDEYAMRMGRTIDVLLEVNASGESTKTGLPPEVVPRMVPDLERFRAVRIRGLMTMAAFEDDPERCRPTFVILRQIRDDVRERLRPHSFHELSMGMTNDFEIAIEEGATMVRIGSALFEGIPREEA